MPNYDRILGAAPDASRPSLADLEALGMRMTEAAGEPVPFDCQDKVTPPLAGYTYLGQFIDHDLTRDHTPLLDAENTPVEKMVNERSPWLDLDQLYGADPDLSEPWFDETSPAEAKKLRLDKTAPSGPPFNLPGGDRLDLPRDSSGKALIPDPRDAENLIITQLHVLFARFHNLAIDQLLRQDIAVPDLPGSRNSAFDKARCLVTWTYQWIVRNNYLPSVVGPGMLAYIRAQPKFMRPFAAKDVFIPVEFSAAAFRFGHSMVRPSYHINYWQTKLHPQPERQGTVPLVDLFSCARGGPLPHDWLIDWTLFYESDTSFNEQETALPINPQLADALQALPDCSIELFVRALDTAEPHRLPVRTLWRGRALRLPTGQDVARYFAAQPDNPDVPQISADEQVVVLGRKHLNKDRNGKLLPCGEKLLELGLTEKTPLWYYILWEAERYPFCGNRLGPLGARIVAEVLDRLIECDPHSYLNASPRWQPANWRFPDGTFQPVACMQDLLELLGGGLPPLHPPHRQSRLHALRKWFSRKLRQRRSAAVSLPLLSFA